MSIIFEKTGEENTEAVLEAAVKTAKEKNLDIIVATSSGKTAFLLRTIADENAYHGRLIAITLSAGASKVDVNELKEKLLEKKIIPITASHAFSAGESGIAQKQGGIYPLMLTADVLRFFGQGTKVAVENSITAAEAGVIKGGMPVVSIGGSSHGADTALIVSPAYARELLDTKIHEYIAKPGLYE